MAQTTVEILYPEFGNQAGDNGNAMYLRACLSHATFIETAFGKVPRLPRAMTCRWSCYAA